MKPASKNRWRQFSLRTLLIAVTLVSLPLGGYVWLRGKAQQQSNAVMALRQLGATVQYEFDAPPGPAARAPNPKAAPPQSA
ncbi:MAG: hypothetical protein WEH44_00935 [Pirellulaceae bacterium]